MFAVARLLQKPNLSAKALDSSPEERFLPVSPSQRTIEIRAGTSGRAVTRIAMNRSEHASAAEECSKTWSPEAKHRHDQCQSSGCDKRHCISKWTLQEEHQPTIEVLAVRLQGFGDLSHAVPTVHKPTSISSDTSCFAHLCAL